MKNQTNQELNYRLYNYKRGQTMRAAAKSLQTKIEGTKQGLVAYKATGMAREDVIAQIESEIARMEKALKEL